MYKFGSANRSKDNPVFREIFYMYGLRIYPFSISERTKDMKRLVKAISMLLAIVMVVSLLPLSVIAEDIHSTHTVKFNLNYNGAHKIPSQKVADGECAVQPEDVTREGWIFEYWYVKTGDGIQKFDLSQPITGDVTLYASWDEDIEYWGPIWNRNIVGAIEDSKEEGDWVYKLPDSVYSHEDQASLQYDNQENVLYYDNMIIAFLVDDIPDIEKKRIADYVNGEIVGSIDGAVQLLQIMIPQTDYKGIMEITDFLMDLEEVLYATYDTYVDTLPTAVVDNNPWNDNEKIIDGKGEIFNPSGNDWWAEAIDAYTAWEYDAYIVDSDILIGQIDTGFDIEHEDLRSKITLPLEGYTENHLEVVEWFAPNTFIGRTNHGTGVAGITVASNNEVGIRGVADFASIIGVDWTTSHGEFNIAQYVDAIKKLITFGVKIINFEVGSPVYSWETIKDKYPEYCKEYAETGAYSNYIDLHYNRVNNEAKILLSALIQLINDGYDEFLCVQGAGNGLDWKGKEPVDASTSGYFASITEDVYNEYIAELPENQNNIPTYEEINDHIIIVGGVSKYRDDNGNYYMHPYNCGPEVDICACSTNIYTTSLNDKYSKLSGTSFAAPMVVGAAAYVWAINPSLNASKVRDILIKSTPYDALGVDWDTNSTYPMLNVGAAVVSRATW